jgi:hypothetical protein
MSDDTQKLNSGKISSEDQSESRDSERDLDEQADLKREMLMDRAGREMDDGRCCSCCPLKAVLITVQMAHVIIFFIMSITFLTLYLSFEGENLSCSIPQDCDPTDSSAECVSISDKFSLCFLCGTITYFVDAICRLLIVVGLCVNKIKMQIVGVIGTILVSTFFQTALLIMMPVFRYNSGGVFCATQDPKYPGSGSLEPYGEYMSQMLSVVGVMWCLSCCTSFVIN